MRPGTLHWIIFPIGLAAGAWALDRYVGDLGARLSRMSWKLVALAGVLNVLYVVGYALTWHVVTKLFAVAIPLRAALGVFLVSVVGKYLPLKVFGTVFRIAQYRAGFGMPLSGLVRSAYMESVAFTAAGIIVAVALLPLVPGVTALLGLNEFVKLGLALAMLLVCLLPGAQRLVFGMVARVVRADPEDAAAASGGMAGVLLLYVLAWLVLGTSLHLICLAVIDAPPHGLWGLAVFAYAVAGLGGMLAIVLPAGIGAREGIMIAALSTALGPADAAVAAVAARVLVTAAELLLAGIAAASGSGARHAPAAGLAAGVERSVTDRERHAP